MALKIKTTIVDGQTTVEPETMEILIAFADHRRFCDDCERVTTGRGGAYCTFGASLIRRLLDRPDVQFVNE